MSCALAAFTRRGCSLMDRIATALKMEQPSEDIRRATSARLSGELGIACFGTLGSWTAARFEDCSSIIFVGATGIAVRAIAPHVRDKLTDPAVVCVDEAGHYVVPLLSGHVGGANDLAGRLSRLIGAYPVISTATDVNGVFAVDEWARAQGLAIVERQLAKEVSASLLEGHGVGFRSDFEIAGALPDGLGATGCELGVHVTLDDLSQPFARTLHLVPRIVTAGVGCRRDTDARALSRALEGALAAGHISPRAVRTIASIDVKADEPALAQLACKLGATCAYHTAAELAAVPGTFSHSPFVEQVVGVDNVCERAACVDGSRLVVPRRAGGGVTVALAAAEVRLAFAVSLPGQAVVPSGAGPAGERGGAPTAEALLSVVGIGPGANGDLTGRARDALVAADVIVGYPVYVDLLKAEFPGKRTITTPMRHETERCELAFEEAEKGHRVALVCSGDPGVYGMAGLCLELSEGHPGVRTQVVPGVTAATGGAAVLGAPLMHDFAVISLSDLLTSCELIERRLERAAEGDFVICLYNPSSRHRPDHLRRACDVVLRHRAPETVCGWVERIGRPGESRGICTLGELCEARLDMFATVFIGNSTTKVVGGCMVTPRGYLQREGDAR